MIENNEFLLKVELGIKFFINFSHTKKTTFYQYHYVVFLIYIFLKHWNKVDEIKKSYLKIKFLKKKKKSHDVMFLKAAFRHKLPKHIFTKNQSFLFFRAEFKGNHRIFIVEKHKHVRNLFRIKAKNPIVSVFAKMPGCQLTFINYFRAACIDDLIFLPK